MSSARSSGGVPQAKQRAPPDSVAHPPDDGRGSGRPPVRVRARADADADAGDGGRSPGPQRPDFRCDFDGLLGSLMWIAVGYLACLALSDGCAARRQRPTPPPPTSPRQQPPPFHWGSNHKTLNPKPPQGQVASAPDSQQPPPAGSGQVINMSPQCLDVATKVLKLQRGGWGDYSPGALYRGAHSAFALGLEKFLPETVPLGGLRLMDIGCGLAMYDIFTLRRFNNSDQVSLHLVDKTNTATVERLAARKVGGFHERGAADFSFYTSVECAKETLVLNGAKERLVEVLPPSPEVLAQLPPESFDMVYSLLSWGHHYPVETYIKEVHTILKVGGRLLLDLRGKSSNRAGGGSKNSACRGAYFLRVNRFRCQVVRARARGKTVLCIKQAESDPVQGDFCRNWRPGIAH